jgi:hypothetical protein
MKKQVLIIVSVALASFLIGTTFSAMALDGENPFVKIWQAINNLQGRVENLEESTNGESEFADFINIITRVEFLQMEHWNWTYIYEYGVSGHWNISKIQTEPFEDRLLSTLSDVTLTAPIGGFMSIPFRHQGYESGIRIYVDRELSEVEIETVRVLIQEYLAKP